MLLITTVTLHILAIHTLPKYILSNIDEHIQKCWLRSFPKLEELN